MYRNMASENYYLARNGIMHTVKITYCMFDCILPVSQIDYHCPRSLRTQISHTDQTCCCKSIDQKEHHRVRLWALESTPPQG